MPGTDQGAACRSWAAALIVFMIHVGKLRHGAAGDVGRGRAWLYLALMQKKLADYLKVLVDNKNLLRYFITYLRLVFAS